MILTYSVFVNTNLTSFQYCINVALFYSSLYGLPECNHFNNYGFNNFIAYQWWACVIEFSDLVPSHRGRVWGFPDGLVPKRSSHPANQLEFISLCLYIMWPGSWPDSIRSDRELSIWGENNSVEWPLFSFYLNTNNIHLKYLTDFLEQIYAN